MKLYYVNEDIPFKSATVHDVSLCKFPGVQKRRKTSVNGQWYGPFLSLDAARNKAKATRQKNIKDCSLCIA